MWMLLVGVSFCQETQKLRYELRIDDETIGFHELEIRYLPAPEGEQRVLDLRTEVEIPGLSWTGRSSGMGGERKGFHALGRDQNGAWEVQAARHPEGLLVTLVTEDGGSSELHRGADGSTLSWFDPELRRSEGELELVNVMTGELERGQLARVDEASWTWTTEQGVYTQVYGPEGHLLRAEHRAWGQSFTLELVGEPPTRTWDGVQASSPAGVSVEEL